MRLESAINTSSQGLETYGKGISVLGDNISNSNTSAFKVQRTEFAALLGERADDRGASLPGGAGDGVAVGRVRVDFEVGAANPTGRGLDVALTGNGFFLVGDPKAPSLTRLGSFQINNEGLLTTSEGLPVLGYSGTDTEALGTINMVNLDREPQPTTAIALFGNVDSSALLGQPPANPVTFREVGASAAFVSTQSAFDASGARRDIQLFYYKTGANQWTARAYVNGEDVGQAANLPVLLGETTLNFNNQGQIPQAQQAQAVLNLNPAWAGGVAQTPFTISLGNLTQFAGGSRIVNTQMDGQGNGDVVGFQVESDGRIFGTTATGERIQAGTLALGDVTNRDGLLRSTGALFTVTQESGALRIGRALTDGRGGMQAAALESSNVDIPKQFVDMIVYQRGYQANSQVLSAASDLLKNTIAMIR
jgi:flagellar hook protein FlgE